VCQTVTVRTHAQEDRVWALASCRQNDIATRRLLQIESAQVDVTQARNTGPNTAPCG
jgi:hypothetical protein